MLPKGPWLNGPLSTQLYCMALLISSCIRAKDLILKSILTFPRSMISKKLKLANYLTFEDDFERLRSNTPMYMNDLFYGQTQNEFWRMDVYLWISRSRVTCHDDVTYLCEMCRLSANRSPHIIISYFPFHIFTLHLFVTCMLFEWGKKLNTI